MSVFASDIASPRLVLQDQLECWRRTAETHEEPGRRKRAAKELMNTPTVEALVESGWGVVVLTEEQITSLECTLENLDTETGHLEVCGDEGIFDGNGAKWSMTCRALTEAECAAHQEPEWLQEWASMHGVETYEDPADEESGIDDQL